MQGVENVASETGEGAIVEGDDVFSGDYAEQIDRFAIAGKEQQVERGIRIFFLEAGEHGKGEYYGAHLGKKNDKDFPRRH